jgi:hypothetical protein
MQEAFEERQKRDAFDDLITPLDTPYHHRRLSDYFGSGATVGLAEAVHGLSSPQRRRHHQRSGTASSADDDRPLEMTVLSKSKAKTSPKESSVEHTATKPNVPHRERGRGRKSDRGRRKSLVSLASEDDLLGRRMKGLTGGLGGDGTGVV